MKIFQKYLQNKFNNIFLKIIYHDQIGFIPKVQEWFNIWKSINIVCKLNQGQKLCD